MTHVTRLMTTLLIAAAVTGCSRQSIEARTPVGISSNINGLQRSACHCGGVERQRDFARRRKMEAQAQEQARAADTDGEK